jgi:GntP family gluconate:H+ symporter
MGLSIFAVLIGILVIILLTTKLGVHPFFALLLACFIIGLGIGLPVSEVLTLSKEGFGNILKSLGFILVLGTTLGVLLEHTGSTQVMASYLLRKTGENRAPLAMSLTGFVVGLPIFCDSGYIVLSGLNRALSQRTGAAPVVMAVCMATGLYAVHCLIPPHPGAMAAAVTIGVDYGRLILFGIVVAIPAMCTGYAWALYAGRTATRSLPAETEKPPVFIVTISTAKAFLPILVPVLLIAVKALFSMAPVSATGWKKPFLLGDPTIALVAGILLALNCKRGWTRNEISRLLSQAVEKAGSILIIIGAGGALGGVLAAAKFGSQLQNLSALHHLGLLAVFLLSFILKTAQGSSTVAIITAASIAAPLLPVLGIEKDFVRMLAVLAMGAGSMTISHANDAYFWVIAKFSDVPVNTMLKVYSVATVFMSLVSLLVIYLLYIFIQ